MNIHEHQAKELLRGFGVPVPGVLHSQWIRLCLPQRR